MYRLSSKQVLLWPRAVVVLNHTGPLMRLSIYIISTHHTVLSGHGANLTSTAYNQASLEWAVGLGPSLSDWGVSSWNYIAYIALA